MNHEVSVADAGMRLDKYLAMHHTDLTRQRIQSLIKDGMVTKDGALCTQPSHKVRASELYVLNVPQPRALDVLPEDIPLDIIYEDAHVLVINKAAGMVVHPAAGHGSGTLVNALLHHCGESLSGIGGVMRPGIVHRLDKDTSGLMLVAKHDAAHQSLAAQLQDRTVSRTYHSWGWGQMQPPHGTIDAPIGRSLRNRKTMAIVAQGQGKSAVTHYRTLGHYLTQPSDRRPAMVAASKFECTLQTGRTHQIRVHLSQAGCGLMGDPVYGAATSKRLGALPAPLPEDAYAVLECFTRQALHAVRIAFRHPDTNEAMHFQCEYPHDIIALEASLKPCYRLA